MLLCFLKINVNYLGFFVFLERFFVKFTDWHYCAANQNMYNNYVRAKVDIG